MNGVLGFALAATGLLALIAFALAVARRKSAKELQSVTAALRAVKWGDGVSSVESLDEVVARLSEIFDRELRYYRSRRGRASFAKALRWIAWGLGTLGLLCPLLAPIVAGEDSALTASLMIWGLEVPLVLAGYLLLGLAASCLACNRFLGLTEGHIRYAKAQLQLEASLNDLTFRWIELKARAALGPAPVDVDAAMAMLKVSREALHKIILDETDRWAEQTELQEAAHAATLQGK